MSEAWSWVVHQDKFTTASMSFRPQIAVVRTYIGTKKRAANGWQTEPYYLDKPNGDPTWTHDGQHRKAMNYTHIHDHRKGRPLPLLDAAGAYSLVDFLIELISTGEWANSHIKFDTACRHGLSESHETELSLALQYMSVRQGGEFNFGIAHEKRDVTHHRVIDDDGNVQLFRQQHKTIKTSKTRACGTVHTARLCWGGDNATLYHNTNFDEAVFLKKDDAGLLAGFWEIPMPDLETNGHVSTTPHPTWPSTGPNQRGTIELHETGDNGFAKLFTPVVAADHPQLQAHMPATTINPMTQAPPNNTALQHLLLAVDDAL